MKKQTVEERRTEILETTCEVVIERGFAGTRISDVAKRLDVSSSLIHYHFDSKEQLLAEAFAHYARKDLAEMLGEVESAPSALAKLDRVIHNYVPEGSDDVEWMLWIDGWGEALRNPMMKKISQELDEQSAELLERVIAGGVEAGEFTCADPRAAAMRLTALVDGLAIQFAAHDGMMDRPPADRARPHRRRGRGRARARCVRGVVRRRGRRTASRRPARRPRPRCASWSPRCSDAVIRNDSRRWVSHVDPGRPLGAEARLRRRGS